MSLHPIELRIRVVEAYENKEGSIRALAERFKVSKNFVNDMIKLKNKTGSLEPKPHAGGHVPKIDELGLKIVEEVLEANPGLILSEICQEYYKKTKVQINIIDAHRACQKLDITFKKKTSTRQKKTQKESRSVEKNSKKKLKQ
jgi:transposase